MKLVTMHEKISFGRPRCYGVAMAPVAHAWPAERKGGGAYRLAVPCATFCTRLRFFLHTVEFVCFCTRCMARASVGYKK